MREKYNIAKEFSSNPGLRFKWMTPKISGEDFREDVLEKFFKENKQILIEVDDIEGNLGSSFLSEAFGELAVKYGIDKFNEIIQFDTNTEKGKINYREMKMRVEEALDKAKK